MPTYEQIENWFNTHFGHIRDANAQAAKAELHSLLNTTPALEDKLTGGDMRKNETTYTPELSED